MSSHKTVMARALQKPEFKTYAARVVANARSAGRNPHPVARHQSRLPRSGTDNHLMLQSTCFKNATGKRPETGSGPLVSRLRQRNGIPLDPERPPFVTSKTRLGTSAVPRGCGVPNSGDRRQFVEVLATACAGQFR